MVEVVRILGYELREDVCLRDIADEVDDLLEVLVMQDLMLLVLDNGCNFLIDLFLLQVEGTIQGEDILLEACVALCSEEFMHSEVRDKEFELQKETDEFIVSLKLISLLRCVLVEDVLVHHIFVVLLEDELHLLEVLLAAEGEVLLGALPTTLDELLLEVDALFEGFVLSFIVGVVEAIGVFRVGSHPSMPTG
jgi:hypothetical protein